MAKEPILGKRGQPIKVQKGYRLAQDCFWQLEEISKELGITIPTVIERLVAKEYRAHKRRLAKAKK